MIDLSDLRISEATPRLLDWGSTLTPSLGGVTQRLNRVGSRFALMVTTPACHIERDGRRWAADMQLAKQQGGRLEFPQVDFAVGSPGTPLAGAVAGGMTLPITGGTAHYEVRKGQFLNIVRGGRTYLYCAAAQAILDDAGAGSVPLTCMLRTQLTGGETVELAKPVIEGWIEGDEMSWTLQVIRTTGFEFAIVERA